MAKESSIHDHTENYSLKEVNYQPPHFPMYHTLSLFCVFHHIILSMCNSLF